MPIPDGDGEETDGLFDGCVLWLDSRWFTESYWWDVSPYRNNGIVHGAKWKENGFYFDGNGDYIDCGNDPIGNNEDVTFVVWVYPEGGMYIISSGAQTSSVGYTIIWNNGQFWFERKTETKVVNSGYFGSYEPKRWYHLGGVYNDAEGTLKVYINGELYDTFTTTTGSYLNEYPKLHIGKPNNSNIAYLKGKIGEVRIYNRTLSAEEMKILYKLTYRRF